MKKLTFIPKEPADGYAIQALWRGEATPEQQRRALKCIIEEICETYHMTFDPESRRWSDFNEGKRHVGRVIVGIAKVNLGKISEAEKKMAEIKKPTVIRKKGK